MRFNALRAFPGVHRRSVLGGAVALTLGELPNRSEAQSGALQAPPADFISDLEYRNLEDEFSYTGNHPPTKEVQDQADKIIRSAPSGPRPYDIALYFIDDAKVPIAFRRQWAAKEPWNPVVRQFLLPYIGQKATDMVPWCASFASWCLDRSGRQRSTTAQAISFLDAAKFETTETPKQGDLVVFRFFEDDAGVAGRNATEMGHVGFFSAWGDVDTPLVLGGNQWSRAGYSIVCEQRFPKEIRMKRNGKPGTLKRVSFVRVV